MISALAAAPGEEGVKDPLKRPCGLVTQDQEASFRERLTSTGMGVMIPDGTPLVYGRFCVEQGPNKLRMTFDGRVTSQGEARLRWMHLPHGSMFGRVRLSPSMGIRGSGAT